MRYRIGFHVGIIVAAALLLTLCSVYPFLPGHHDMLAVPLATMVQMFGVVGLGLVPGGVIWLAAPRLGFAVSVWTTLVAAGVALLLALVATLSVGNAFGVLTLAVSLVVLVRVIPALGRLRRAAPRGIHPAPIYLVLLPSLLFTSQLALAGPMTAWSRDRAIANAGAFIADIEQYRNSHDRYPQSLQAQHRDYSTGVVGVERYAYVPQGTSYNLLFEQPRFLLDRFGTREWVVYNPSGEHRVYSHTSWRLAPPEAEHARQGWYASGDTAHAHWRYFLFD